MNLNVHAIYKETVLKLTPLYGETEAQSISNVLLEDLLGIDRITRLTKPQALLPANQYALVTDAVTRLLRGEPIQHIIGYSYFLGRRYKVNRHTLVPRPETEELVQLIIDQNKISDPKILDIGTGTGCIAISLALGISGSRVTAVDVSEEALSVTKSNDTSLGSNVEMCPMDILTESPVDHYDIIVSNPPYIPELDKSTMHTNVVDFEPKLALFVSDDDPLIFYQRIAQIGKKHIRSEGKLYFEIHEKYGTHVKDLMHDFGYQNISIVQDLNGKDRIVSGQID